MNMITRRELLLAGAAATTLPLLPASGAGRRRRPLPSTASRIGVWNDQMTEQMTAAQLTFAATNYAGSQKQTRAFTDRLHVINPGFIVLHYRLALGAGPALFIRQNRWITDWPNVSTHEDWFYHASGGRRYHQLTWDWWVMDPDGPWRDYWTAQTTAECRMNDSDGVFADSCSVPNYFGADTFAPPMLPYDPPFEMRWSRKINRFLRHIRRQFGDSYYIIPNAGSWVTTRDVTDYSIADGVMIEGFAQWGPGSYFAEVDWVLQMDRILSLARRKKAVIHQAYLDDVADMKSRGFIIASYLLTKGEHSYVNMEMGFAPEWFPEYRLRLGPAIDPLPASIATFRADGVFRRRFERGLAIANPGDTAVEVTLGTPMRLVTPVGGGALPDDASESRMRLITKRVSRVVVVDAHSGAVLLA